MKSAQHRAWHPAGLQHVQGSWYRKLGFLSCPADKDRWGHNGLDIRCLQMVYGPPDCYRFTQNCWQDQEQSKKGLGRRLLQATLVGRRGQGGLLHLK